MSLLDPLGTFAVGTATAKLMSGKFKPKFGARTVVSFVIIIIFILAFIAGLVYGIMNNDLEIIIGCILGIFTFSYALLLNPIAQSSKSYYIEFPNENSIVGFRLFYKGKLVDLKYKIDNEGKIAFLNDKSKISCLAYADGSRMGSFTKWRIINYFVKWLNDNNLMSKEITVTYE